MAAGSRAVPGRDELVGTVPPWSVLSKALTEASALPGPPSCRGQLPGAPVIPTLSDSGVSLPSAAAWKVQAVSRALAGSRGSRTAITQCVKVVAACVVKTSPGRAGRGGNPRVAGSSWALDAGLGFGALPASEAHFVCSCHLAV